MAPNSKATEIAQAQGYEPLSSQGGFTPLVGPMFHRTDPELGFQLGLLVEQKHSNAAGIAHGGLLTTLIDNGLGNAVIRALPAPPAALTLSLTVNFVAAARAGDWLETRASIRRITRSVVFVDGEIRCGDTVILTAQGIWKRLRPRP